MNLAEALLGSPSAIKANLRHPGTGDAVGDGYRSQRFLHCDPLNGLDDLCLIEPMLGCLSYQLSTESTYSHATCRPDLSLDVKTSSTHLFTALLPVLLQPQLL